MTDHPRITVDPKVLTGKPVVKGTRLSVEFIVGLLADAWTADEIIAQYPGITKEDITACLKYAQDVLSAERVYPAQ